ncbi:PKD domain-containing protein [Sungkyunkwania multivorans]|uniref:PKD domain-containing protein n=1 Tax=Sungkyunkwania multivorans TaxID=1173618 RepID=A0ABW3CV30_9FLAO
MKKQFKAQNKSIVLKNTLWQMFAVIVLFAYSCDDLDKYELPEAGSIPDATPPEANFVATQNEGPDDQWKTYSFSNQSTSATSYRWDFGDGNTSTELEPSNTYPGEGSFTVSLTAQDNLGVASTYSEVIDVVEPEAAAIPDPVLVNADFDRLPKSSGSDCTCSAWINRSLGDQGESSSGNGGSNNLIKFDNNEPDHAYQEFEVAPNADYTISMVANFRSPMGGSFPSMLEVRVLAGTGYVDGYSPTYYTETTEFPQDNFGYTSIAQVENPANNLFEETISNPNDSGYLTYTYTFNSGPNNSVALFIRGIGGPATGGNGGNYGYNSGDEELRVDFVEITAIN